MKIILGAGISGLGAYCADSNSYIFEQTNKGGGLCANFKIDNFTFDQAVHLSFTKESLVRSYFDRVKHISHHPVPYSWYHEGWFQHPAQNNLYPLPAREKVGAVKGFIERCGENDTENFEDWTRSQYGDWLYEHLFRPYNEKYWCTELKELATDWIENRIYRPTIDEVLYGSYSPETPNTYYAKEMRYPCGGGYEAFLISIIEQAEEDKHIKYQKKVIQVDTDRHEVRFKDGDTIAYKELLSSIPLTDIFDMVIGCPEEVKKAANQLEYTSLSLVSIAFNRVLDLDKMWFYIYDRDIMAARAYMPSVKSPQNAPAGCSSIQFEIYFHPQVGAPGQDACMENCLYALKKMGIAEKEDILFMDCRVVPYGNIIFKKGTVKTAEYLTGWLRKSGITPIGRFGEWKYLWSDQAFLSGYHAAEKQLTNGEKE
ncbi:MAG: hypothetical protein HFI13_12760 [Lachnospiraceae bacterium]|nr:hypothetical protein [Lachnospiraceae bacterium]